MWRLARINLRSTAVFLAIWLLFDAMLNLRYPGDEPALWYLLPSVDVVVLFAYLALFGALKRDVPVEVRVVIVAWMLLVRLLRLGDGLQQAYYGQPFHIASDLPLVPELLRFAYSTLPWWQLTPAVLLGLLGLVGICYALYRGVAYAERYLREAKQALLVACLALLACLTTLLVGRPDEYRGLFWTGFAAGSAARVRQELKFSFNILSDRARFASQIEATEARLASMPHDLKRLGGENVLLFVVESYGETVFRLPKYVEATRSFYDQLEAELGARGFHSATGVLSSSTYGGRSWLANATLSTGIATSDQLEFALVLAKRPKAIAKFFEAAGYRTVLAQPGTTRPWPKGAFYGFDQRYYAWNFGYRGPSFGWATMPDQYVVDFIDRQELSVHPSSLFVQYVLVSSHAPWNVQPPHVADWSRLKDGALFKHLAPLTYPIVWPKFENAGDAYIRSITYDLQVLKEYLRDQVQGDALVIILGDHQPVSEVNGHSASRGVPVHVLSRREAFVQPFYARGYRPGMRPGPAGPVASLATLLPDLLRDFSSPSN
jgi:hypothetical protein